MKSENEIDQLFKKGMSDPQIPFNELNWQKMSEKLAAQEKRRVIPLWLYLTSGIAAALIVLIFWVLKTPDIATEKGTKQELEVKITPPVKIEEATGNSAETDIFKENNVKGGVKSEKVKTAVPFKDERIAVIKTVPSDSMIELPNRLISEQLLSAGKFNELVLPQISGKIAFYNYMVKPPRISQKENQGTIILQDPFQPKRSPFTLSIIAAPDVSTTSSSIPSKVSSNFGLLTSYSLTKKISFTSGVVYARKLYNYGSATTGAYIGAPTANVQTDADCFVLDVPLNINYQVFQKRNFSIGVNTGLSSYFMLKEKYRYISKDQTGNSKVSTLEFYNRNHHILGVANFSLNFKQKVSSNLSIGVQPFYKVPLTGIGYHDTNLKSKGVAFSLNFSLPSGRK